jgi:Acetyl esterase (deacetylase)
VFMTWGYNDNVCPPTTSYSVYNVLTCPKEALLTPVNEHWVSTETRYDQLDWIKKHLK